MDTNSENLDEQKETNELPKELIDWLNVNGIYANGPDYYVQSLREKRLGSYSPQVVEDAEPKPKQEGPVCPQCGNAINEEWPFCPECGTPLTRG